MINYITEFDQYKDSIPEFIVKLYHILESKEYSDYLCWSEDREILIKNGKKLQDKVLPHFFRHRHLSSFVRQLNMYKFNKVNKPMKQKNHMYFQNEHFRRYQIKEMTKIKRNSRKSRKEEKELETPDNHESEGEQSEISINKQLENNNLLTYKTYVKNTVREISDSLKRIQIMYPDTKNQMDGAINLCNQLLEAPDPPEQNNINQVSMSIDDSLQNKNMLSTMRLLPRLQSLIFPSQCSFYHFS